MKWATSTTQLYLVQLATGPPISSTGSATANSQRGLFRGRSSFTSGSTTCSAPTSTRSGALAKKLAGTVMASVALLHHLSRCSSKIVVLGLMPCGSIAPKAGAPHAYDWPSVYAGAIAAANRQIKARVERHPSLQFLDCGRLLLTQNGTAVSRELTIDGLHPSAGGYHALLSRCILPGISRILSP
uniref:Platelet-activating factor acetylhydrolase IB subunit beta/gamma n=1 Tax=Tetraselmis sp. GSL018 TaxID=582737 RepID=A0A061RQ32_9CHLO